MKVIQFTIKETGLNSLSPNTFFKKSNFAGSFQNGLMVDLKWGSHFELYFKQGNGYFEAGKLFNQSSDFEFHFKMTQHFEKRVFLNFTSRLQ